MVEFSIRVNFIKSGWDIEGKWDNRILFTKEFFILLVKRLIGIKK